MSFNNTKTHRKPDCEPRYVVSMRLNPKCGKMEYYLEGEVLAAFVKLYPRHSNIRLMRWFGLSFSTLQRLRRKHGLEKDMRKIRKEHAADIKKTCERNGYYASLRGKAPSEACFEACRRLWAEGFNPIKRLREKDPRKYDRLMRKNSERRKELIRKERLREEYGLERKTRLVLSSYPMSRKATCQKWAMISQCNYFADPDNPRSVCFDAETRRSEKREATARKHGLDIVDCTE